MKDSASLRKEVIHHLWNNGNLNPRSSPVFHKFIEELIKRDRAELKNELLIELAKADSYYEAVEVVKNFKIK